MSDDHLIYLDNNATTRCDPQVVSAMLPLLSEEYGNPHSAHAMGRQAHEAMTEAIASIAHNVGAGPEEIVITSGATESNNLAIFGHCRHPRTGGRHIVTAVTEHPAVLDPIARLEKEEGFEVTRLPVDAAGRIDLQQFSDSLRDDTALVSIMLANNEIGVIQPLPEIIRIAHERGIAVHTDATQGIGRLPVNVAELEVDLLSCSAHKFYGPKGVGFLYVGRHGRRARIKPLAEGGGQQRRLRPGTMNPAGIVGMAKALELCTDGLDAKRERIASLRDRLYAGLCERVTGLKLNGPDLKGDERLSGNLNVIFPGVQGEALMIATPRLAISSGSSCSSVDPVPSHVLTALGLSETEARSSLRMGVGRFNTEDEIEQAITMLGDAYQQHCI